MLRSFILPFFIICSIGARGQAIPQVILDKLSELQDTYRGNLPCADCSGIESTLTLQCEAPCDHGKYMLVDKYLNTKKGDQTNKIMGKWGLVKYSAVKKNELIVIALNVDDTAKMSFYEVTKKGDLLPVNKDYNKIEAPTDLTLIKLQE